MFSENQLRSANALILHLHAGASSAGFGTFPAWSLAALQQRLAFDGAVWGLIAEPGSATGPRTANAHLLGLPQAVLKDFERARAHELSGTSPLGEVIAIDTTDAAWQGSPHQVLRHHAGRFDLAHTLFLRLAESSGSGQQFILLSRTAAAGAFGAQEAGDFELLAPHLMQAYATRRRLFLDRPAAAPARPQASATISAVALIDSTGFVHDHHPRFVPLLRREWTDWPGKRLPDPLSELAARRVGSTWRYLGTQIFARFEPVDDLYVVTARPRHRADALTAREGDVAQRYAAGKNFREIADALQLSPATVRSHLRNVFGKLDIRNKTQLAESLR